MSFTSSTTFDELQTLQEKLDFIRERIVTKKEEAIALFRQLLKEINARVGVMDEATLWNKVIALKNALGIDVLSDEDEQQLTAIQTHFLAITTDNLLGAIQSLTTPVGSLSLIKSKELEEELRKNVMARFLRERQYLPENWKTHVDAIDFVCTLEGSFKQEAQQFGGAAKLLRDAIDLAENFGNVFERIANAAEVLSSPAPVRPGKGSSR